MTEWICPEAVTKWGVRRKERKAGKEPAKEKTKRKVIVNKLNYTHLKQ